MMMDTAIQQTNNTVAQTPVTPLERQTIIQRLHSKWPLDLATRVENQAYEKSHGMKPTYSRFVQLYYQQVQVALHNRNNQQQHQQQQPMNNTMTFSNPLPNHPQQVTVPVSNANPMVNQTARFPSVQPTPHMSNPIGSTVVNSMVPVREPPKFNPAPSTNVPSFPPSVSTTTIDISQVHSTQRMNNPNSNDFQPRFPNLSRPRVPIPINNYPTTTPSNPSSLPIVNPNPSSSGDQLLQRILLSNIDGGNNSSTIQNRPTTTTTTTAPTIMSHTVRLPNPVNNNPNNSTRTSQQQLPPSPSVVVLPTSTVQVLPSTNIAIQQSPLNTNNNNNPQSISTTGSSPVNRSVPSAGSVNSDDEISNLVKYLKENVNRLQILMQKFTNDGNTEKIRQVQVVHQQIIQFINNPTLETLANAKHFREMLDRIPNRQAPPSQPPPTTTTVPANVFNQCLKATSDFLLRDDKERVNVLKRYLEPLNDVINGVPHKIMRLDVDQSFPPIKLRSFHQTTFLNQLNDEINQLPKEIFAIERTCLTRFRERNSFDDEQQIYRTGLILRCKLIEKHQPILPALQLQITTAYPEQAPEILSLTKSNPPRLDFVADDDHPFFEQLSLIFVSHVFKLRPKHTVTEILHLWRLSVQTAL